MDAAYSIYGLAQPGIHHAYLVDYAFTPAVLQTAKRDRRLRLLHGNFGSPEVIREVPAVDVILLFDVLLHQVDPDWDGIIRAYAASTRSFAVVQPQWVGSAATVRLVDLGREKYLANVPRLPEHELLFDRLEERHVIHNRPYIDVPDVWQWGITDDDLISAMGAAGFTTVHQENGGRWGELPAFEMHGFVFAKA